MKTNRNFAAQLLRNAKALNRRAHRAFVHKDGNAICKALILYIENIGWLLCILIALFCIGAGFVKPHCFITAIFYFIISGVIRANIEDNRKSFYVGMEK